MSARLNGVTIVSASAGSGKTYRLTEEVTRAIEPGAESRVPLEGLVAVTYTRKAHAELAARIRQKLVRAGAFEDGMRLPLAYLGTVHAACLRLLQEFALDAGLSPNVDVVAGDQSKLLRQALEAALAGPLRQRLDHLAWRFQLRVDPKIKRVDWLSPVADIMDLARANRIPAHSLSAMAERSAAGLLGLLRTPEGDGPAIDEALRNELPKARAALAEKGDGTGATQKALEEITKAERRLVDGELDWSDWAKLATLATGKKSAPLVQALRETADRHQAHPQLHAELRELTHAIFEAAQRGLAEYQQWKEQRRVVDYVDMLDRALDLVAHPRVQSELGSRLRFAVVDEFQDTSPIQLALFLRLHNLTGRSVWVGDRKQCIFEYAGADPMLMDAVANAVHEGGGKRDRLGCNYRSRPELVHACSELFVAALARHGFSRDEVEVSPKRTTPEELKILPPMGVWCLESKNKEDDGEAIAEGVRKMLELPAHTPIVDRETAHVRAVRPGDIAVLVATNAEARGIAAGLHARGIRAAIARAGLLATPEGSLAAAAMHWLLDQRDELAAATLDALTGFDGHTAEAWLEQRLRQLASEAPRETPSPNSWRASLSVVRASLPVLSPSEALDAALAALDATLACSRWPDPAQRVANIDALRALAVGYEDRCAQEHEAATVTGMLRYFDDMGQETLQKDEILASDNQHVPTDDQAVVISTYHRSKGLEWPVVVLASLDRKERRDAFAVTPESDAKEFDPQNPLAGRWIRYWPWPFGSKTKVPLTDDAEKSGEGRRISEREDKERVRLLYVGFTRARDHLVLAVRVAKGKANTPWLETLADATGQELLELPLEPMTDAVTRIRTDQGKTLNVPTRVVVVNADRPEERNEERGSTQWFARGPAPAVDRLPYRIAPSDTEGAEPSQTGNLGAVEKLPSAITLQSAGYAFDALGNAVHAFLAADVDGLTQEERIERARRLLGGQGMTGVIRPETLVKSGDDFRAWVDAKWPNASWHREIPVDAFVESPQGYQRLNGIIDLLVETSEGYVVIDHKTFPGTTEASWRAKCATFAPQLRAYADVVRRAEGKPVLACWVHLPIGGGMVEIR